MRHCSASNPKLPLDLTWLLMYMHVNKAVATGLGKVSSARGPAEILLKKKKNKKKVQSHELDLN